MLIFQVKFVADRVLAAVSEGQEVLLFSGAGISTAAKIPDYRGPDGAWTRRDKGLPAPKSIGLEQAVPTYAHRAIVAMTRCNVSLGWKCQPL